MNKVQFKGNEGCHVEKEICMRRMTVIMRGAKTVIVIKENESFIG